ncbi:MAG: universal stress protein [Angustibacter sp.]
MSFEQPARRRERPLVVVGYDESDASRAAVHWAAAEAAAAGSDLAVVVAWESEAGSVGGRSGGEWAQQAADDAVALARGTAGDAVEVSTVVDFGPPAAVLLQAARDADLLVLGTRGHVGAVGVLLGSVSRECLRAGEVPVVLLGPDATPALENRVLVTSVHGAAAGPAVQWAVQRAVSRHHPVHLLDRWSVHAMGPGLTVGHEYEAARQEALERHSEAMEELHTMVAGRVPVTGELVEGRGIDVEYARSNAGDLLVVEWDDTEHRPSLRYERCPVVMVPAPVAATVV